MKRLATQVDPGNQLEPHQIQNFYNDKRRIFLEIHDIIDFGFIRDSKTNSTQFFYVIS